MANEEIGVTDCPCCDWPDASVRKSVKSGKPYILCEECGFQGFARQAKAVQSLTAKTRHRIGDGPAPDAKKPATNNPPPAAPAPQPKKRGFFDDIAEF